MSFLSAAQASSSNSQSINTGSLSFNPIISLDSPESSIRQDNPVDQTTRLSDTSSSSTARAKATLSTTGGGDGESDGSEGFGAGVGLSSNRGSQGSGPYNLSGDLIPGVSGGILSGNSGLLLLGGLAIAAFFLAKKFL
jgi:hypothetical protein